MNTVASQGFSISTASFAETRPLAGLRIDERDPDLTGSTPESEARAEQVMQCASARCARFGGRPARRTTTTGGHQPSTLTTITTTVRFNSSTLSTRSDQAQTGVSCPCVDRLCLIRASCPGCGHLARPSVVPSCPITTNLGAVASLLPPLAFSLIHRLVSPVISTASPARAPRTARSTPPSGALLPPSPPRAETLIYYFSAPPLPGLASASCLLATPTPRLPGAGGPPSSGGSAPARLGIGGVELQNDSCPSSTAARENSHGTGRTTPDIPCRQAPRPALARPLAGQEGNWTLSLGCATTTSSGTALCERHRGLRRYQLWSPTS
jgi:hypothetical protein